MRATFVPQSWWRAGLVAAGLVCATLPPMAVAQISLPGGVKIDKPGNAKKPVPRIRDAARNGLASKLPLKADRQSEPRPPKETTRRPRDSVPGVAIKREPSEPPKRIVCSGGAVEDGACRCPQGTTRTVAGARSFACEKATVREAPRPSGPFTGCRGGRVVDGACVCADQRTARRVGRNAFACDPPVVIVGPPGHAMPPAGLVAPLAAPAFSPPPSGAPPPLSPPPGAPPAQSPRLPPFVQGDEQVPDEVLVAMAPATVPSLDDEIAQAFGLVILERTAIALIDRRLVRFRIPDGRSVATVVAQLQGDPRASLPQANFIYREQADPAPAMPAATANAIPQYALLKVAAPAAHALAHGRGVIVAVIDSTIDATHGDLADALAKSHDAVGDGNAAPDAHGTAIAGIIAGRGMVAGVAPGVRLLGVRAFQQGSGRRQGRTTTAVLLKALDWSMAEGARVLNLSFAGPRDPIVHQALQAADARNTVIVAAAGNGGPGAPLAYPAAYGEVIAVTATDENDGLYPQANHGDYIAVAAPGVDVLVPAPGQAHDLQSGTSFAAAFVSGIAALMLERDPRATPAMLRRALAATAVDLGPPGPDPQFGAGRVDAHAALKALATATP